MNMFAMVDCNAFYCSCERLFDPSLEKRPVIVLSNNDGCAVSRSEEAKALGIEMGTPEFMIYQKIRTHNIAVFSSNYTLYEDISERVMQTMATLAPGIEVYSIDEAFLDLRHVRREDIFTFGMKIRNRVAQHIGIPVTVGIAATKTLAKMANRHAKKNCKGTGVFAATDTSLVQSLLNNTKVDEIWGVGKKHAAWLRHHEVYTAAQLASMPDPWISRHLTVVGLRLVNELRGVPAIGFESSPPAKQNICTSRSFGALTSDINVIREAVANHAAACATKLRQQITAARNVYVFLQTNPHRTSDMQFARSITISLPIASNDDGAIIKASLRALDMIFHPAFLYKKCGVMVMELVQENEVQAAMFEPETIRKRRRVMTTIDNINRSKGRETVRMAATVGDKQWSLRARHLSPQYTTNIHQLPQINDHDVQPV
jgi:DNA polymerase V